MRTLISVFIVIVMASVSVAIDPPHTSDLSVTCANCHNPGITYTYATIDNTPWNEICWSCHDFGASGSKLESDTHSAISTGDEAVKQHWGGTWTNECRTCHDPHTNEQARSYQSAYPTGAWLYTGTIQSSTYNTITVSGSPWADDELVGKTLHPKAGGAFFYMITDNTPNTIVVAGSMYPFIRMAGGTFAISYGKLIRKDFNTGRAIINSGGEVFDSSPFRTVKFLNSSGPYSGATAGKDTDAATDAICVVCHTQTSHMNVGVAKYGASFDTKPSYNHYYSDDQSCWKSSCHESAPKGFAAGCTNCHGYPPVADTFGGPDGLVNSPARTGSSSAGAHGAHTNSSGPAFSCDTCHSQGMPETPVVGDNRIQMGLNVYGNSSASYDGGSLSAPYSYESTDDTVVSTGGTLTCQSVYCHSNVQTSPPGGTVTYGSPQWGNPLTGQCGTCHEADGVNGYGTRMDSGSHDRHLGGLGACGGSYGCEQAAFESYACSECHEGRGANSVFHADGSVQLSLASGGAYSGTSQPGDAYGTCSNVYCHSNVQGADGTGGPTAYSTPSWNAPSGSCRGCHRAAFDFDFLSYHYPVAADGNMSTISTGSHTKHLTYTLNVQNNRTVYKCAICHKWSPQTATFGCVDTLCHQAPQKLHANGYVDVIIDNAVWSGGTYNGGGIPGDSYGTCSNVYCHSNVQGADGTSPPTYAEPFWGSDPIPCGDCHSQTMDSGNHSAHTSRYACPVCHNGAGIGSSNHVNRNIEVSMNPPFGYGATPAYSQSGSNPPQNGFDSCTNIYCHSIAQTAGGGALTGSSGEYKAPLWGDAVTCSSCHNNPPGSGSHSRHVGIYSYACEKCHLGSVPPASTTHVNSTVEVSLDSGTISIQPGATCDSLVTVDLPSRATSSHTPSPGNGFSSCANTYCHSDGTSLATNAIADNVSPAWGDTTTCTSCHSYPPSYPQDSPKANGHSHHPAYSCKRCHYTTSNDGSTIASPSNHANGVYDVAPDPSDTFSGQPVSFTYIFDPGGGYCSNASCHGGDKQWGNESGMYTLDVNINWSNDPDICSGIQFSPTVSGGTPPYSYCWDFGDGQSSSEATPFHIYPSGDVYYADLFVRDAKMHSGKHIHNAVVPEELVNQLPTSNFSLYMKGYTAILTDLSSDPDYNRCGHSGAGTIYIDWGCANPVETSAIDLTDTPSNQTFTFTYGGSGTCTGYHKVEDNLGASPGQTNFTVTVPSFDGGTWSTMTSLPNFGGFPEEVSTGGSLAYAGGYVYALVGKNTNRFYRYSVSGNSWSAMASAPGAIGTGGSLAYAGGDYIYALGGGGTSTLYRYSISGNSWSTMTDAPGGIGAGGLAYDGGDYLYTLNGYLSNRAFYRYSISGNSWSTMAQTPGTIGAGGSLAYDGGDYIYALRGNNSSAFYRYSISGNSWSTMASITGAVNAGGALAHTGGDFIYALRGAGSNGFYLYWISQNRWFTLTGAPGTISGGGALAYDGGNLIYALRGSSTNAFYRYNPALQ